MNFRTKKKAFNLLEEEREPLHTLEGTVDVLPNVPPVQYTTVAITLHFLTPAEKTKKKNDGRTQKTKEEKGKKEEIFFLLKLQQSIKEARAASSIKRPISKRFYKITK